MGRQLSRRRRMLGSYNPFHAKGSSDPRPATQSPAAISYIKCTMDQTQDLEHPVRGHGFAQESGLCCAVVAQRHGERVVFLVDWAGW